MTEKLKQLSEKGIQWWKEASWQRKLGLAAMVTLVAGTFAAIVVLSSKTDWQRLVADASPEDVQAIVAQLKKANIPCRVSASGTAVEVDASMVDQARMEIASSGLFGSGVGFELFDRREFGMTSFQERVNFRRALEGELARTIRSLAEVKSARVHLVIPKRALFKEDRKDPSASVVVNLKPGKKLSERQLQGIRQLVASAVEGLKPGRVTVLDGHGAILARVITDPGQQVANELIEYQRRAEKVLEERILALLEPVVGTGKVVAQVTAEVDYK
ncbi:MAG: flagellar M-ring protein FliF, partial [Deltaproteobacteria bacterium]